MRQLVLDLADRSYSIEIQQGLITDANHIESYCDGNKVLILSNQTIAPIYLAQLQDGFSAAKTLYSLCLPDGEEFKNLEHFSQVIDFLIKHQFKRNDTLIALGGGVIGDLGGFAAACYQRGMGFIQLPTSLLAQVDSSVGGKTAVNHPSGKNMIGAFYQPKVVIIDPNTLDTLPCREYHSAFAEIIKYALLGDSEIENLLLKESQRLLKRDKKLLSELVYLCCQAKALVVSKDEIEQQGRALLNLGHTFGHALEKLTEYKQYLHGEAVAIGMSMAINLSLTQGRISRERADRYISLLKLFQLPSKADIAITAEDILMAMKHDKKNMSDRYRLVLPEGSACVIVEESKSPQLLEAITRQLC